MRNAAIVLFLFIFSTVSKAQNLDFGKVSKQELTEKKHPKDTSAVAAILFKKAKTSFFYTEKDGFQCETKYEIRLKIYKKEGFSWANYSIPYYIGWTNLGKDNIFFSDVTTYNLENDKIVKTKLSSDGTFKEKINDYWMKKTITFPNVKEGSVIEFKYKLVSENLVKLPDFDFQELIPVNFAEYRTEIPVNYEYKTILNGYSKVDQESKDEIITQSINAAFNQTNYLTYTLRKNKYTLENIPALKEEPYIDNAENYRIKIKNELSAVVFKDVAPKKYAETWDDVATDISQNDHFKKQIESKGFFESNLNSILSNSSNQTETVDAILKHVKNRIKWNGIYGIFPKEGLKNSYNNRTGNVSDINLNVLVLLRNAGINAFPVLVSTRKNGKIFFPSRDDFNYIIVKAIVDGKQVLLDATDPNTTSNILPFRSINGKGVMISLTGKSEEVSLVPTFLSKSITFVQADLKENGSINGKVRATKSDYQAYFFRDRYMGINQEMYLEKLESDYKNVNISDYKIENIEDFDKTIIETFSFTNSNEVNLNNKTIIFNPLLFFTKSVNPFKEEKRFMPIDFVFPTQEKYLITITIPEGYRVEYLPQSYNVALPNNDIVINFNLSSDPTKIVINSSFDINQAVFEPNYYQDIKNIFKLYIEKQTESIILKKIE
ncbi:DUF3857 domain-containing protein [Flavobacterium orientale]|uniref:DUF3857 domain-containing protein n=1 Tax=Flavobacterium orientale TaxID=1756020 RepID=A0A916XYB0_9FLAO|nr:DUF3857 domain-containing protein [Flavobacterium orientale]GGD20545.1 hypothetical protein GCM10011343_08810 [Flavobacterium orientale]